MQKIVKLTVIDIEIVFIEQSPQFPNSDVPSFEVIDFLEGIVWLNVLDLFPGDFDDPESVEYFHDKRDEMSLDLSCKAPVLRVSALVALPKRRDFI